MTGTRLSISAVFVLSLASAGLAAEPAFAPLSEAFAALQARAMPSLQAQKSAVQSLAAPSTVNDPHLQTLGSPERYATQDEATAAMQAAEKNLAGYLIVDAATSFDDNPDYPYTYKVDFIAAPNLQNLESPVRYASQDEAAAAMAAAVKILTGAGYVIVDSATYFDTNPDYPYQYSVNFIAAPTAK